MRKQKSKKDRSATIDSESYQKPQITTGYKKVTVSPSAKTPNQKKYIKAMDMYDVVICEGPAGTGKTHLAVGMAINAYQKGLVKKIVIARPTVDAGEELGFLPGDIDDKMDPYIRPALDELESFLPFDKVREMREEHVIEIVPIAYMRGRTFRQSFIVCDECQNLTIEQTKMLLTRIGAQSKMVLTGDTRQSDLHRDSRGAFKFAYHLLDKCEGSCAISLTEKDIQRHSLVSHFVQNWDKELDNFQKPATIKGVEYQNYDLLDEW